MNFRTTSKRKSSKITPLASKKRRKPGSATEEVTFDFSAREEYLTGFHKRKLQRIKHAKEEAIKKERAERIVARKNVCLLHKVYPDTYKSFSSEMSENRILRSECRL